MEPLTILYRDTDRTPWLHALRYAAGQHGLAVNVEPVGRRENQELLKEDPPPVLAENYYALQALRARGAPIVCLATSITWLNEQLLVAPSISSIEELQGNRFAIRGVASSELIERLWLKDQGLESMETVVYSDQEVGRWGQWHKVASGECQACLVCHYYADAPAQAGLRRLPIERYGHIGNVTLTARRDLVERDREAAETLVRSAFDATRLFKTEPGTVMGMLEGELRPLLRFGDELPLGRLYSLLRDELPEFPVPSTEALSNMRRAALPRFPELEDFNPLLMWDLSFASKIADERGGPRLE